MTKLQHDSEVLADGQQVFTAGAFIWHDFVGVKKVFLAKRADTKKFLPGIYEFPGGHIEFGENIRKGLAREVREEFDMDVTIGDPFYVHDYRNLIKKSHSVEIVYFAQFVGDIGNITLQPEDHSEFGWFDEDTVRTDIAESRKITLTMGAFEVDEPIDYELAALMKGFTLLRGDTMETS